MALPLIDRTFRCALNWSNGTGGIAVNVMHVRLPSGTAGPDAVYNCINAHVTANMWAAVSNGAAVESVQVTPLDGTSVTFVGFTGEPSKWTGASAGNAIPQSANVVKLTTAKRGRSFRGRLFLPFTSEGAQNGGLIGSTEQAAATTAWNAFAGAIKVDGTTPLGLVVASYKIPEANDVQTLILETETATQRRRQERNR